MMMRSPYSDKSLTKHLKQNPEHIEAIEELLHSESEQLKHLDRHENTDKPISAEEVDRIYHKAAATVDEFLGVEQSTKPPWNYGGLGARDPVSVITQFNYGAFATVIGTSMTSDISSAIAMTPFYAVFSFTAHKKAQNPRYASIRNKSYITLRPADRPRTLFYMAHEYTHHVQETNNLRHPTKNIFREGHACGVERHVCDSLARDEGDSRLLYDVSSRRRDLLGDVYAWLCKAHKQKPYMSLLAPHEKLMSRIGGLPGQPSVHAKGTALFAIQELSEGPDIYSRAIRHEDVLHVGAGE